MIDPIVLSLTFGGIKTHKTKTVFEAAPTQGSKNKYFVIPPEELAVQIGHE